ncbi:MAG TPA: uroporphyrinogen-III C-methyltransferase [Gallionella sp.]
MNDQTSQPENTVPDTAEQTLNRKPSAGIIARINLTQLLLAVLVAVFIWQWLDGQRTINAMQKQVAEKIGEMSVDSKTSQALLGQAQDQVRDLAAKVALMEARYAEAQNQRAALEALYNDLSVNRDEMALAEVEQLLLIAEQQLRLSANVKAALIAMQSGDARLQRMDRAVFAGLRKVIGQDMDKLRALPSVDVPGINHQLNSLISAVDELPLVHQQRVAQQAEQASAPDEGQEAWRRVLREVWQELKQLVRIENTGKQDIPLLAPDQEFFLRENLKLRLLAARLALLSRDESSFRHELKTAQQWISRYFDGESAQSGKIQDALKRLSASSISIELPDIGASLAAVRNYRLTRDSDTRGVFKGPSKATQHQSSRVAQ